MRLPCQGMGQPSEPVCKKRTAVRFAPRARYDRSCYFAVVGKKVHETRERLLCQGLALMSRDGMAGVTLGQLADRVGMSKSGVFAHFRSKDEVQIGLLEQMTRVVAPVVVEPAMATPEGLPRLEVLVRNWLG